MLNWCAAVCILVCILVGGEIFRELHSFKVTHYEVVSSKWSSAEESGTILFLSDLHNHRYGKQNERLLSAIRKERPELILIGGDILVGKAGISYEPAKKLVEDLCRICPVYYANGNHEQRMKERPEKYGNTFRHYKNALLYAGVQFLENESTEVLLNKNRVRITGLELPMESYEKFEEYSVNVEDIEDLVGKPDKQCMEILLAHNPEYCESYLAWGADLTLCGHFHGGLVCLPNGRSVITPQFHLFPIYSGELSVKNGQTVIVSRGLGTHTINVRLFNQAEVIALHIRNGRSR